MAYGLALFGDADGIRDGYGVATSDSLAVTFVAERELPQEWRMLRRRRRWPIASPSAFPLPMAVAAGEAHTPGPGQLVTLSAALTGVAALAARDRKRLQLGLPCEGAVDVDAPAGPRRHVHVSVFPEESTDRVTAPGVGGRSPVLEELRARVLALTDARHVFGRLLWSFFRDSQPSHVKENQCETALARFFDWAIYLAPAGGRTMAERAIKEAEDLSAGERAEYVRAAHPRVGFFRVEEVERDIGLTVLDLGSKDRLHVRERLGTRTLRPGNVLVGMLSQIDEQDYALGGGCQVYPEIDNPPQLPPRGPMHELPPAFESVMFGATTDWIQHAPLPVVREAYEEFGEALHATGDRLPPYLELQDMIAKAEGPLDVFRALNVNWWTENEFEVMGAFLMRIWNSTPRAELGGKSPDEMARKAAPGRNRRKPGRRKR